MALKDDLKKIVAGDVLDDEQTLATYSKDASIFEIKPQLIVYPKDVEDIKALVSYCSSNGLSIIPRSAGTDMSGGAIGEGIILDLTRYFNKIISIEGQTALVQPGVYYRDFEAETLKKGLILPSFTASKDICTLGGMVANNSAGERTLAFGQTEKFVKNLKIILSDGNEYFFQAIKKNELSSKIAQSQDQNNLEGKIYSQVLELINENLDLINKAKPKTHKNSTGYSIWNVLGDDGGLDLTKLFVGSQGTLGIITEIEFSLERINHHTNLLVIPLNSIDKLDEVINRVLEFNPQAFEVYDDQTIKYAIRFLPELLTHFKLNNPVEVHQQFNDERQLEAKHQLPQLTLLAQFAAQTDEKAYRKTYNAEKSLAEFNLKTKIIRTEKEAEKYWVIRHESFNMLRHHAGHMRSAPFIDDIIVRPEKLPAFLPRLDTIIKRYEASLGPSKFIYTLAGHIGDGNFHIIPLVDLADPEVKATIPALSEEVFKLVFDYGGSMSGEHNDGLIRGPFLEEMYGKDMYQLFKKIKDIFDPKGIFNPHKKSDATFEYSYSHLSKN